MLLYPPLLLIVVAAATVGDAQPAGTPARAYRDGVERGYGVTFRTPPDYLSGVVHHYLDHSSGCNIDNNSVLILSVGHTPADSNKDSYNLFTQLMGGSLNRTLYQDVDSSVAHSDGLKLGQYLQAVRGIFAPRYWIHDYLNGHTLCSGPVFGQDDAVVVHHRGGLGSGVSCSLNVRSNGIVVSRTDTPPWWTHDKRSLVLKLDLRAYPHRNYHIGVAVTTTFYSILLAHRYYWRRVFSADLSDASPFSPADCVRPLFRDIRELTHAYYDALFSPPVGRIIMYKRNTDQDWVHIFTQDDIPTRQRYGDDWVDYSVRNASELENSFCGWQWCSVFPGGCNFDKAKKMMGLLQARPMKDHRDRTKQAAGASSRGGAPVHYPILNINLFNRAYFQGEGWGSYVVTASPLDHSPGSEQYDENTVICQLGMRDCSMAVYGTTGDADADYGRWFDSPTVEGYSCACRHWNHPGHSTFYVRPWSFWYYNYTTARSTQVRVRLMGPYDSSRSKPNTGPPLRVRFHYQCMSAFVGPQNTVRRLAFDHTEHSMLAAPKLPIRDTPHTAILRSNMWSEPTHLRHGRMEWVRNDAWTVPDDPMPVESVVCYNHNAVIYLRTDRVFDACIAASDPTRLEVYNTSAPYYLGSDYLWHTNLTNTFIMTNPRELTVRLPSVLRFIRVKDVSHSPILVPRFCSMPFHYCARETRTNPSSKDNPTGASCHCDSLNSLPGSSDPTSIHNAYYNGTYMIVLDNQPLSGFVLEMACPYPANEDPKTAQMPYLRSAPLCPGAGGVVEYPPNDDTSVRRASNNTNSTGHTTSGGDSSLGLHFWKNRHVRTFIDGGVHDHPSSHGLTLGSIIALGLGVSMYGLGILFVVYYVK